MLNPRFDLPEEHIQPWHLLAVPLLAMLILVSQASHPRPLSSWHVALPGGPQPAEGTMGSEAALVDPRELPAEVAALPELVDERTPHSATFEVADDKYRTVLSSRPLHYRDQRGDWQVINPLFQQTEENFIVTENNLRSRAGLRRAWLSTGVEDAAIYWQAEALYAGDRRLAEALPEADAPAKALDGGYTLHYANSWSDPSLAEELLSQPGSIEHLLVLAERPAWSGDGPPPASLDLEAELRLFPGASLWAGGERLTGPATVDGALEIRNQRGEPVLRLEPVRAFEVNDPLAGVSGDYQLRPGEEDGAWQVRVRTPWSWWQAAERRYPAVIDPTMTVLQSTGSGTGGMAWVSNSSGESGGDYELGQVVLGSNNGSAHYAGYIQFNHLPATLQNALLQVQHAELKMTAGYYHRPSYKHDGPDYKALAMQKSIQLSEVDLGAVCPDPAAGCFSLVDNRLNDPTFNWNNRPTALINSQTLPVKVGAPTGGGKGVPTSFNVTQTISDWYTLTPRPDHGPMFHVTTTGATCPLNVPAVPHTPPPYQIEDQPQLVPPCTRFRLWPQSVQLLIDYTDVVMPPGTNLLNDPGVPSYKDGIFENTNHQYKLLPKDPSEPNRWRGVAVRGNHMLQQELPARTNLGLLDFTDDAENPERLLENTGTSKADQTSFFFINDHACASSGVCEQGVDLRAEVIRDEKNNFEDDQQRNYRLQYVRAEPYNAGPGKNPSLYDPFPSDELVHLYEFDALAREDLTIFVTSTVTSTQALELMLLMPTDDGTVAQTIVSQGQVNGASVKDQGNGVRVLRNTMLPRDGDYALAVINHQPPDTDPQQPQRTLQYPLTIQVIRCPYGTIYAARLDDCQPIKIPTAGTPSRTISALDNLIVYSEGGFDEEPDGTWCTTDEMLGTPLIGPAVDGRYASVANGHVCWDGSALTTTPESGVGVVAEQNLNPGYGATGPDFMYGDSALWPVPPNVPTGVVGTNDGSSLLPTPTTRVNIQPLAENWGDVTANVTDQIDLASMKVTSDATVNAQVTTDVNADPAPVTWQVEWELYTLPTASYSYAAQSTQTPALHGQGGFVDLASLEIHIGTAGNPGRLETVDSTTNGGMPLVVQFHALNVRGAQSAEMGAAMQELEGVVRPPGEPYLKGGTSKSCDHPISGAPTSCLDIRDPGYTWQSDGSADNVIAAWKLPDITIQDNMGSVAMSGPNGVMLFSNDHPLASTSPNFDQSFSFDSFGASVSVVQAKCFEEDEDTEIVTVIKGEAQMGLPSVGETGVPPYVKVGFQLCKDSLTFVALELGLPEPGIPVGSTGVGVSLIGGTVTIAPDHVVITIDIDFQTMDQSMVTNGKGEVTIDTAGLFSLEAEADIVEFFHAELYLHVAWAPLDVLLQAGVDCCGGIIGGELYTHLWMGQGWQNKYSWLPDDKAIHFTGYVEAGLFIPEGYVTDFPPLPPFNFEISLKISFGEFCESPSSCSDPRWGMSTTMTIAGVSMGAYVDGDGMDFFFGTDNHVLIDQFGSGNALLREAAPLAPGPIVTPGQTQINLWPPPHSSLDDWDVELPGDACTETGNSISCSFDVTGSGRAGFSFSWQNGAPTPALIAPDNTPITPNNAASYGVTMTNTTTSNTQGVLYNLRPVSGQTLSGSWTMELSNIDAGLPPGINNNYRLAAFSDPPAPEVQWVTPVISGTTPTGNSLTVQWNATRDGAPLSNGVWGELVYTPVYSKPTEAGVFLGIPIAGELQGNAGSYNWDVTGVPSGEYAVGLRLDDREQANGHVVSWAPGTVVISDTTPPPAPNIISINPAPGMADNLVVSWERPDAADLAGYLIEYDYPNWRNESLLRTVRRVPRGPESIFFNGKQLWFEGTEVARLTGLAPNYTTEICVRAYDFSENVGPCNTHTFTLPRAPESVLGPPQEFSVNNGVDGIFDLNWMPPATGGPVEGYLVGYGPAGCLLPDVDAVAEEGQTPLDVGNTLNYQLSGLTPGQRYTLGVAAYKANNFVGETAYTSGVYGDLGDYDADGLPDVWADAYDISDANDDPDEDGLTNGEEWELGSNPIHADSDGDGFYDGEEAAWNTDPCNAALEPPYKVGPKLVVFGPSVAQFIVASNEDGSTTQTLDLFNLGAGELAWTATTTASWLQLEPLPDDRLAMTADPDGLQPGVYEGEVTIQTSPTRLQAPGAEGEVTLQEGVTVAVRLRVLPKQVTRVLLPVIER